MRNRLSFSHGLCAALALCSTAPVLADTPVKMKYDAQAPGAMKVLERPYSGYCSIKGCADNVWSSSLFWYNRTVVLNAGNRDYDVMEMSLPTERRVALTSGSNSVVLSLKVMEAYMTAVPDDGSLAPNGYFPIDKLYDCTETYQYRGSNYVSTIWQPRSSSGTTSVQCKTYRSGVGAPYYWSFRAGVEPALALAVLGPPPAAGLYTGYLSYSAGTLPSHDFNIGRNGVMGPAPERYAFSLEVNPELSVTFPDPADTLALKPRHGGTARPGDTLHGRFPFQLSSNGAFRVSYRCATLAPDGRCALGTSGTAVKAPFDVALNWAAAPPLAPGYPPDGAPTVDGRIWGFSPDAGGSFSGHFAFDMLDTQPMYAAPRKQWEGLVTLVFDAGL